MVDKNTMLLNLILDKVLILLKKTIQVLLTSHLAKIHIILYNFTEIMVIVDSSEHNYDMMHNLVMLPKDL